MGSQVLHELEHIRMVETRFVWHKPPIIITRLTPYFNTLYYTLGSPTAVSASFPLLTVALSLVLGDAPASCHAGIVGRPSTGSGEEGVLLDIVGPRLSRRALRDLSSCCSSARDCVWLSLFRSIIWVEIMKCKK
jgi:hypothetical protein